MRRGLIAVAVLLTLSGTSRAQDISTVPVIPPLKATFATTAQDEPRPVSRVVDKKFVLVGVALNAAMIADTKSTFDVMHRCDQCYEANPYARPFINHGPTVAFTAGEAFDITVLTVAAKMKGSDRPIWRKTWWIVPIALTTGHLLAMQHNMRLAR